MKPQLVGPPGVFAALILTVAVLPVAIAAKVDRSEGKKQYATHQCNYCHGVDAAGIARRGDEDAGDLSGYSRGGPKLAAYLRQQVDLNGSKHTKPFKGSDEELQAIIDWLGSLEAQE